jgi:hypothetical protein
LADLALRDLQKRLLHLKELSLFDLIPTQRDRSVTLARLGRTAVTLAMAAMARRFPPDELTSFPMVRYAVVRY